MGNLVSLNDAPADIGTAIEMYRPPSFISPYGQIIGEFTRSDVEPDVDVYCTQLLEKNQEVFVGVFPSFIMFDEILDSGNVTIEVLNSTGGVVPSAPVALSSTAVALAMVKFTTGTNNEEFYYRISPDSGLVHGEYILVDNGELASGAPIGRRLQDGLDSDTIPFELEFFDLYNTAQKAATYDSFSIGGIPFSATAQTIRLGYIAADSAIDFSVTSDSVHPSVQRVLLGEGGTIIDNTNLTLVDGNVDFQIAATEAEYGYLVLKFDGETDVQVEAQHAVQSNITTHSCIFKVNCPASIISIKGLEANDLVAVDLKMTGSLNANNRAIPFVDRNFGTEYGSFRTTQSCSANFRSSGVIFAPTTASGTVDFDIAPPTIIQGCTPELGIKATPLTINGYLGIEDSLQNFTNSVRSTCENDNCTSGSFDFSSSNGFGTVSDLTVLVQGFAGNRLTLSMDNDVFYNESFDETCTDDPVILRDVVLPALTSTDESLSIQFEFVESTVCTNRQNLVLGVVGFTDATAAPSPGPNQGGLVDDLPLVAGLSTAAAFVVLGSLLFLFFRSSAQAATGAAEVVVKQKEEA